MVTIGTATIGVVTIIMALTEIITMIIIMVTTIMAVIMAQETVTITVLIHTIQDEEVAQQILLDIQAKISILMEPTDEELHEEPRLVAMQ